MEEINKIDIRKDYRNSTVEKYRNIGFELEAAYILAKKSESKYGPDRSNNLAYLLGNDKLVDFIKKYKSSEKEKSKEVVEEIFWALSYLENGIYATREHGITVERANQIVSQIAETLTRYKSMADYISSLFWWSSFFGSEEEKREVFNDVQNLINLLNDKKVRRILHNWKEEGAKRNLKYFSYLVSAGQYRAAKDLVVKKGKLKETTKITNIRDKIDKFHQYIRRIVNKYK